MTEINNLDHAIEFSTKKYLHRQIFKKGTQKIPALVPHPRVQYINQTSRCPDNAYKGLVPSQFLPSYFPKLIRAKVHDGNSEGR